MRYQRWVGGVWKEGDLWPCAALAGNVSVAMGKPHTLLGVAFSQNGNYCHFFCAIWFHIQGYELPADPDEVRRIR
jgi:hypothetical protein